MSAFLFVPVSSLGAQTNDLPVARSLPASAERPIVPSKPWMLPGSLWNTKTQKSTETVGSIQFIPAVPQDHSFPGTRLLFTNIDNYVLSDVTGFQPIRFLAGRGPVQGNYAHWHETYFMSDGFTHLVNIGNTNDDGESGIRFWKGSHQNHWAMIVPSQPGYKLAFIRDGLIDAMVLDEDGRVIIGRLPPNDYGPPAARLHVRGMINERQLVVEAADDQQHPVFEVTTHGHKDKHLIVTAEGRVGIGIDQPRGALDITGTVILRDARQTTLQATQDTKRDTIDQHAAKMNAHQRLPAMPPPQQDTQGRQMIDWFAQHRALVKELETAHAYIAELHKDLGQLRSQVTKIEHHLKDGLR